MNLTFIKIHDRWMAEFKVESDFNLHIEGVKQGNISLFQRTTENGEYAYIHTAVTPTSGTIYDSDFSAILYPKYIRVSCATEPTLAVVTSGGEITPIKIKSDVIPLGVSIQHVNGYAYTTEEWTEEGFSNDLANGVIVATEEHRFVIAKDIVGTGMNWSSDTSNAVDGLAVVSSKNEAQIDYKGKGNTALMLATDTSGAGYSCDNFAFTNGQKGYLPALGEWYIAYQNKSAIDAALALIGGTALGSKYYWSSTQYGGASAWYLRWDNGNTNYYDKGGNYYARPFTTL